MIASEYKTVESPKHTNINSPIVDSYLNSIADSQPLSMAQEAILAHRIRQGDDAARNELVEANLRFVVAVAKEYQNRGLPMADLISVGNIGLMTAATRFDETKGFKFITYAVWWIRQAMRQAVMEQPTVRLPVNRLEMINKISRTCDELQQRQGESKSAQVAEVLGVSEARVEQLRATPNNLCCSLDAPMGEQEDMAMIDQLEDEDQSTPEQEFIDHVQRENISIELASMDEREASIIKLYFGFEGNMPMTLEQIGRRFDVTRERVRQIKERALTRLRRPSVFERFS